MAFCSNSGFGRLVDTDVIYTGPSITCGGTTVNPGDTVREFISVVFLCANDIVVNVDGNTLPIPDGTGSKVAFVGSGTYTQTGGSDIVVPSGNMGILSWDGNEWSLSQSVEMPVEVKSDVIEEGIDIAPTTDAVAKWGMSQNKYVFNGFIATGKNLFNKATVRSGFWLATGTGVIEPVNQAWKISEYIPVKKGLPYFMSGANSTLYRISIFENVGDNNPVQFVQGSQLIIPNIDGFAVVLVTHQTSGDYRDTIQFEQGDTATAYEPFIGEDVEEIYEKFLPKRLIDIEKGGQVAIDDKRLVDGDTVYKAIKPNTDLLNNITTRENFFDKANIVTGQLLNVPSGIPLEEITVEDAAGWSRSYPVKLEEGDYKILGITIGQNAMFAGLFPTASLEGGDTQVGERVFNNTFSVTGNKYLSFSVESPSYTANLDVIQIKKMSSPDEYVPYDKIVINPESMPDARSDGDRDLEVYVDSEIVRVRSEYDAVNDLVQEYQYQNYPTTNGVFSGSKVYLIGKSDSISGNLSASLVHDINDSISPMGTSQYWFIAGQHGYYIARATAAGNTFEVNQEVKDNTGREFIVIHKEGSFVYLAPKITVVGETITRSWSQGSTGFTSLSLLDDSYTASVSAVGGYQLKPMGTVTKQKILLDDIEVTDTGIYKGNSVELVDEAEFIDPIGASFNGISGMSGNTLMRVTQSYFFKGKSVYLTSNLDMVSWLPFIKYHGIQPLGLMPTGDFTPYAIFPKVKPQPASGGRPAVDWNYPTDINDPTATKYPKYLFNVNTDDIENINNIPERTVQFLKDTSENFKIGFASGLDLETGFTSVSKRGDYTSEAFHIATNVSNKTYFRVLTSSKFSNGVLPSSFFGQFNGYFCYYEPKEDIQAYVVHTKDVSYVYIHTQSVFEKGSVTVDNIEGKQLVMVEQKGVELLTDRVINETVHIKTVDSLANYIVLKTV